MAKKSKILALRYHPDENDLAVTYFDIAGSQINGPERIKALNHIIKYFLEHAPRDDPYRACFDKRRDALVSLTEFTEKKEEPAKAAPEKRKEMKKAPEEAPVWPQGQEDGFEESPQEDNSDDIMSGIFDSLGMTEEL